MLKNINLQLIEPRESLKTEYYAFIQEFKDLKEELIPFVLKYDDKNFETLIRIIKGFPKGLNIPEGFVAHSTYWLIKNNKKILGALNIRHKLTARLKHNGGLIGYGIRPSERQKEYATEILRLGLLRANKLGFKSVLITCKKKNIGSVKTIINNGGKLDSEELIDGEMIQRYWIKLE